MFWSPSCQNLIIIEEHHRASHRYRIDRVTPGMGLFRLFCSFFFPPMLRFTAVLFFPWQCSSLSVLRHNDRPRHRHTSAPSCSDRWGAGASGRAGVAARRSRWAGRLEWALISWRARPASCCTLWSCRSLRGNGDDQDARRDEHGKGLDHGYININGCDGGLAGHWHGCSGLVVRSGRNE